MTALAITGCGVISAGGAGLEALEAAVSGPAGGAGAARSDAVGLPLPEPAGHALADFDPRAFLGRRGTAFLDRATALALVACGAALEDSGLAVGDDTRRRVGVVLGTTVGSLRSMSDYTRETLVDERPYLVNPALFPNTVMNCAAGQCAIRYGLKGVNATIAGGEMAFLAVLRYAANALRRGYADALFAGAVEEYTAHRAWAVHVTEPGAAAGEGAAVFALEPAAAARSAGRHVDGELLAVAAGFVPGADGGSVAAGLRACAGRALAEARVDPAEVWLVSDGPGVDEATAGMGLGGVRRLPIREALGACQGVSAGLQLAATLGRHRRAPERDGRVSLIAAATPEGGVGAALVRGFSRGGAGRG